MGVEGVSQLDFWETSQVALNNREREAEPCPVWVIQVASSSQPGGGTAPIVGAAASTQDLCRPRVLFIRQLMSLTQDIQGSQGATATA